ncbi:hypothetical protein F5X98DRAFT_388098 [Xylaria grammica]|nr:hypothetical protein F5X98DRAFT_388098 [Xylaria grammica]
MEIVPSSPDGTQRAYIVERGNFHQAKVDIVYLSHGRLSGEDSEMASLLVLRIAFKNLTVRRRITAAKILLGLQPDRDDPNPNKLEIKKIAPESASYVSNTNYVISTTIRGGTGRPENRTTVEWILGERPGENGECPKAIQVAVILTRSSMSKFNVSMEIRAASSGFSFGDGTMGGGTIALDPKFESYGLQNETPNINQQFLGEFDFNARDSHSAAPPTSPSGLGFGPDEANDTTEQPPVEERSDGLGKFMLELESDPEPGLDPQSHTDGTRQDGVLALMWGSPETVGPPLTDTTTTSESLSIALEGPFKGIPAKKWRGKLDFQLLREYFPWLDPTKPVKSGDRALGGAAGKPSPAACVLLFQQFNKSAFRSLDELEGLLSNEDVSPILDIMGICEENLDTRGDKNGSHFHGSVPPEPGMEGYLKEGDVFVVQTPIYGDEFWCLFALAGKTPKHVAAVLYVGSNINATDIIHTVKSQAKDCAHHLLLLLELFEDHLKRTKGLFKEVINSITEVDQFLLEKLPQGDPSNNYAVNEISQGRQQRKFRDQALEYATKMHQLHLARMNLVRLRQRRNFETKLAELLEPTLKDKYDLEVRMRIYKTRAESHDTDLEDLPQRIDSQSSVITSLLTQQDARLQYRLTLSTVEDSRGMMTLSFITIVFLPGAFVATLFSTNMFAFKSLNQEVAIYFGLVVPLTLILLGIWKLWLNFHPVILDDIESGGAEKRGRKHGKND